MDSTAAPSLRDALVKWEKLRLWYNGIMLIAGYGISHGLQRHMDAQALLGYWGSAILFGVTANLCFTLGPALESYTYAFRGSGLGNGRILLFLLGLAITVAATLAFTLGLNLLYRGPFG